jgi:chromosome segregation ATPase
MNRQARQVPIATADSDATQSVADSDAATGSSANKAGQLASLTESQASLSAVINELQTKLTNNEQSLSSQLESSRRAYSQLLESQKSIESKISAIQAKLAGMSKSVRVWTDASGRTVTASLVSADADSVSLLRDGKQVVIPLIKLSQADQQFVAQWSK